MSPRRVPCVQLFCAALLISVAVAVAQEDGLDFDVDQLECTSSSGSGSGSDSGMAAAARGVQVKGQSGKFTLYDTSLGPGPQCDPDALTVTIDALYVAVPLSPQNQSDWVRNLGWRCLAGGLSAPGPNGVVDGRRRKGVA